MSQPYGIYVNPYTGYIYGTDAGSFEGAGYLYQWSPEGKLLGKHKVYINPGHFLAIPPVGYWDGIEGIKNEQLKMNNDVIYDLQGRKVSYGKSLPLKGFGGSDIYIRNGKKILITQ